VFRYVLRVCIIKKLAHNYLNTTRNTRASLPRASAQTMCVHHNMYEGAGEARMACVTYAVGEAVWC